MGTRSTLALLPFARLWYCLDTAYHLINHQDSDVCDLRLEDAARWYHLPSKGWTVQIDQDPK